MYSNFFVDSLNSNFNNWWDVEQWHSFRYNFIHSNKYPDIGFVHDLPNEPYVENLTLKKDVVEKFIAIYKKKAKIFEEIIKSLSEKEYPQIIFIRTFYSNPFKYELPNIIFTALKNYCDPIKFVFLNILLYEPGQEPEPTQEVWYNSSEEPKLLFEDAGSFCFTIKTQKIIPTPWAAGPVLLNFLKDYYV